MYAVICKGVFLVFKTQIHRVGMVTDFNNMPYIQEFFVICNNRNALLLRFFLILASLLIVSFCRRIATICFYCFCNMMIFTFQSFLKDYGIWFNGWLVIGFKQAVQSSKKHGHLHTYRGLVRFYFSLESKLMYMY